MLSVEIIALGKLKEDYLKKAIGKYEKRLSTHCSFRITKLAPQRLYQNPTEAEISKALQKEGEEILQKAGNSVLISLCIEGKQLSSSELSKYIDTCSINGDSKISFIIGSSFGLSNEIKEKSKLKLSMSKMTFPHQLARVMLAEQIYRAFEISAGTKYHK